MLKGTHDRILQGNQLNEITPQLVADLVAEMDDGEQAAFFNHLSEVMNLWSVHYCFQLQAIIDSTEPALTHEAIRLMVDIGEYAGSKPWAA